MSFCSFNDKLPIDVLVKYEIKSENTEKILDNIYNLAQELGINDEMSICKLYAYLLYACKLSQDAQFHYDKDVKADDYSNITLGYGCCRNIADGLKKVLDRFNIKNCILTVSFNTKLMFELQKDKKLHSVNLIVTDKGYFIYDATNMLFFKISKRFLKAMNKDSKVRPIRICKTFDDREYDYLDAELARDIEDESYEETFNSKKLLKELRPNCLYNFEEIRKIYNDNQDTFREKKEVINKFYDDNLNNIKRIASTI